MRRQIYEFRRKAVEAAKGKGALTGGAGSADQNDQAGNQQMHRRRAERENNQGYPETEKLLQLSNIFGVSVDYLLKDDTCKEGTEEKGYYVSKEMAQGFLMKESRVSRSVAVGFMFWALAGIPFCMFPNHSSWRLLGMGVFIFLGICAVVIGMFHEQDTYAVLKQEVLLFDYEYRKELCREYQVRREKYGFVDVPCCILFVAAIVALAATKRGYLPWSEYHAFIFLGLAAGLLGFVYTAGMLDAYEQLVENEKYTGRLLFKLRKKIRTKID